MFLLTQPVNHYVSQNPNLTRKFGDILLDDSQVKLGTTITILPKRASDRATYLTPTPDGKIDEEAIAQVEVVDDDSGESFFNTTYELPQFADRDVEELVVGDRTFKLGNPDNLAEGEFSYQEDGTVTVKSRTRINFKAVLLFKGMFDTLEVYHPKKSQICNLSARSLSIIHAWNSEGKVTVSRQLEQHPSLTFTFSACRRDKEDIVRSLSNGTIFTVFNAKWKIANLTINELVQTRRIIVSVNCQGYLAPLGTPSHSPMDKPIRKKQSSGGTTVVAYNSNVSTNQAAAEAGMSYSGPSLKVRVTRNTSYEETYTMRNVLKPRALAASGFIFYNGHGVEVRNWYGTKTHTINDRQVRSNTLNYSYNGHGSLLSGVKLHTEYRNMQVGLDFNEDAADNNAGVTQRWSFENCQDLGDLYSPKEYKGSRYEMPSSEIFRSPSLNFDAGGPTKTATRITELNGTITFSETYKYGYVFTSNDVYFVHNPGKDNQRITFGSAFDSPVTYWKEVERTVTNYIYAPSRQGGYLTEIRITGFKLARLRQETDELEAVNLQGQISALNSTGISREENEDKRRFKAQLEAYEFNQRLPIRDRTYYYLKRHRDFFEDTVQPGSDCNDLWVEPKFIARMKRLQREYIVAEDPRNSEEKIYPPIVTGQYLQESEITTITNTTFPYKFEKRTLRKNAEGNFLKNVLVLGNVTQSHGKPGIAPRLSRLQDYRQGSDRRNYLRYRYDRYFLNSPGVIYSGVKAIEGSKSYPELDDPYDVRRAAETELSMINTQNCLTVQIAIDWREGIDEGDFVLFRGKRWKILSIQQNFNIESDRVLVESLVLSLGYYLKPSLSLQRRNFCNRGAATASAMIADFNAKQVLLPPLPAPDIYYKFDGDLTDNGEQN